MNTDISTAFRAITVKQARTAHDALRIELRIADHIQSRRSDLDGWAWVEVFVGRTCYTLCMGPRGGVKSLVREVVQ